MTGATSLDRTTRRIAGACSLIAGALAVFWLIRILRGQVTRLGSTTDVEINIVFGSIVAFGFGRVAVLREISRDSTWVLILVAPQMAFWAARFVFKLNNRRSPDFGPAGIVTFAVASC
jgi:hypothetical protein